jgi:hypothetical protein
MGKLIRMAVTAALCASTAAAAFEFTMADGQVTGSFDTTVSAGALWRAQGRDPSRIAITNGGTARSPNEDDGNLNYDKGDLVSALAKVTHELDIKYRNLGFFTRVLYFYDFAIADKEGLPPEARKRLKNDVWLLDAYARGQFDVGGRKLNLRLGNQVVSWGESTFIGNGINVVNPIDVAKLRAPGAELKEALLPTAMVWASQEVTDNVALEGYYQINYRKTRLEPRGTFFSTNDFISPGGDAAYIGFGRRRDQNQPLVPPTGATAAIAQVWAPRLPDRDPRDGGQFGVAAHVLVPQLPGTELGVYALNYHSRTPLVSSIRGTTTQALNVASGGGSARYFADYPENIHLYGVGLSTSAPFGIALQGEYSYRPNQPLQVSAIELLLATLGAANNLTGNAAAAVPVGTELTGFRRVKMHQVQMTGTKSFGPQLGAGQLIVVGEVGYTHLKLTPGVLFNGPAVFLPAVGSSTATSFGSTQPDMKGYATPNSWGYRLVARVDYSNWVGGATFSPRIAFAHDVRGVSPTFNQDTQAITAGLGVGYRQNLQADVSYTTFRGGRVYSGTDPTPVPAGQPQTFASHANPFIDRDFFAITVSYSF